MGLQNDLNEVCEIAKSRNLGLRKYVVMRFGAHRAKENLFNYNIDGNLLHFVSSHKDLNVLIDPELRFHDHVRSVVQKAGGLAGELLCSTVCRTPNFMVSLFVSHIRPIMDFGSSVWNVSYLGDITLLESVQRRWTKQIADISHLA